MSMLLIQTIIGVHGVGRGWRGVCRGGVVGVALGVGRDRGRGLESGVEW